MDSEQAQSELAVLKRGPLGSTLDTEMLETDPVYLGDAPRCSKCDEYIGARPWLALQKVTLTLHGAQWGDVAFRGIAGKDFLMFTQAAEAFEARGLTGLAGFEPVEVTQSNRPELAAPKHMSMWLWHTAAPWLTVSEAESIAPARASVRPAGWAEFWAP